MKNIYTKDLLKAMYTLNKGVPMNNEELLVICPWFNSNIYKGKNYCSIKKRFDDGIYEMKKNVNVETRTWYTYKQFCRKHVLDEKIINYLDYYTIVQNIPK